MARPTLQRQGILFSNCAVVSGTSPYFCGGDCGKYVSDSKFPSFQIRVLNAAHVMLSQPIMRLLLLRQEQIPKSRAMHWVVHELNFEIDRMVGQRLRGVHISEPYFDLPWMISHTMDPTSPLYKTTPEQMEANSTEIILVLEGTNESTSTVVQSRWSYVPSEIVWHAKFDSCVTYHPSIFGKKCYRVDAKLLSKWSPEPEPDAGDWTPPTSKIVRESVYYERPSPRPSSSTTPQSTTSDD